jgi:hypothetical protein
MARAHNKAMKELLGHPSAVGHDVISVTATAVSGVAAHTALTAGGTNGATLFAVPRDGVLDFVCSNVSPALGAGTLNVAVHKNGAVVMSGVLNSTQSRQYASVFSPRSGNIVTVSSGDVLAAYYSISSALSPGVQSYGVNTRIGLTYRE